MSTRRVAPVVVAVAMLVAACTATVETTTSVTTAEDSTTLPQPPPTGEPGEPEPTTTEAVASTTSVTEPGSPETTVPETTVPPTTEPDAAYHPTPPLGLAPPEPLPGSDGASGSGCAPGSADLPDGVWFVFMTERRADAVVGDLACFWFGDIAYEVGEAAGEEVANDFFISNDSDRTRSTAVTPDTVVWTLAGDPTEGHAEVSYAEWPSTSPSYVPCPGDFCTIWLYVNDGVVTDIVEQYLP